MSGGSMGYLYHAVRDAEFIEDTELRKLFKLHLNKVAAALRAIEWVDSGDCREGSENKAIQEVLELTGNSLLITYIDDLIDRLEIQKRVYIGGDNESRE